jgi:hypothetical protein
MNRRLQLYHERAVAHDLFIGLAAPGSIDLPSTCCTSLPG